MILPLAGSDKYINVVYFNVIFFFNHDRSKAEQFCKVDIVAIKK